jgi:hypothetical protein
MISFAVQKQYSDLPFTHSAVIIQNIYVKMTFILGPYCNNQIGQGFAKMKLIYFRRRCLKSSIITIQFRIAVLLGGT